jgi:hypothetical protein
MENSSKSIAAPVYATRTYCTVEVHLHALLTSTLDGDGQFHEPNPPGWKLLDIFGSYPNFVCWGGSTRHNTRHLPSARRRRRLQFAAFNYRPIYRHSFSSNLETVISLLQVAYVISTVVRFCLFPQCLPQTKYCSTGVQTGMISPWTNELWTAVHRLTRPKVSVA